MNIFGEPLQPCRRQKNDTGGSWDSAGFCNEPHGGVHQICAFFDDKNKNFAQKTYQPSNWSSTDRLHKPHCICLGAYSLYNARGNNNMPLDCHAIPATALDSRYVDKWSTWNGHELPHQIQHGVNALYKTCLAQATKEKQKKIMTQKYKNIQKSYS
jgi:hypothetical protein